jgi:hypothetical protein
VRLDVRDEPQSGAQLVWARPGGAAPRATTVLSPAAARSVRRLGEAPKPVSGLTEAWREVPASDGRVVSGLFFFQRGGSVQVTRALPAVGWQVRLAAGSLGGRGNPTDAATSFDGLDLEQVDHTPALIRLIPSLRACLSQPSYEDRPGGVRACARRGDGLRASADRKSCEALGDSLVAAVATRLSGRRAPRECTPRAATTAGKQLPAASRLSMRNSPRTRHRHAALSLRPRSR